MRYYYRYYWLWKGLMKRLGRGSYNDYSSAHAVVFISAWQIVNVFYLIEHVLFRTSRGCGACNPHGRLHLLEAAMATIYVVNNVVFWRQQEGPNAFDQLPLSTKRMWYWATAAHVAGSLYLIF